MLPRSSTAQFLLEVPPEPALGTVSSSQCSDMYVYSRVKRLMPKLSLCCRCQEAKCPDGRGVLPGWAVEKLGSSHEPGWTDVHASGSPQQQQIGLLGVCTSPCL